MERRNTKGIFICYRREEAAAYAGWLGDRLSEHYGEHKVFRDIDSIEPGLDFVEAIQRAVDSAEVVLVVIGKAWLTAVDATGRQRLQNPNDYVRREIATALQRNIRVLPVLIQGASMPGTEELPDDLAALARRNAFELHDTSWRDDTSRLIRVLENVGVRRENPRHAKQEHTPGREQGQWERKAILSSVSATVTGAALLAGFAAKLISRDDISRDTYELISLAASIANIGTLVGLMGLHTLQAASYGRQGLVGFLASVVSPTVLLVWNAWALLIIGGSVTSLPPSWLYWLGSWSLPVGFLLFGVVTLRAKVLTPWCGLLLLAYGVPTLVRLVVLGNVGTVTSIVLGVGDSLIWLALAYVLWRQHRVLPQPTRED